MGSLSADSQANGSPDGNLEQIYDTRTLEDSCCPRNCLGPGGISFTIFKRCRDEFALLKEGNRTVLQTIVSAMMTTAGSVHIRSARLSYRVFQYDKIVCQEAFLFCYGLNQSTVKMWRSEIRARNRFVSHNHRLIGRDGIRANRARSQADRTTLIQFLSSVGENIGMPLPTRPGDLIFLPPYATRRLLYDTYKKELNRNSTAVPVAWGTFREWWHEKCNHIRIHSIDKGMCSLCVNVQNRLKGLRPQDVGLELERHQNHINASLYGLNFYNETKAQAQQKWRAFRDIDDKLELGHVSFDFSHAIEYPSRAREKMDEYFMPKIRVHVFGIVNEGSGTQHNYLFHKPGRSNPDAVISMLNDYLEYKVPQLDNCEFFRLRAVLIDDAYVHVWSN